MRIAMVGNFDLAYKGTMAARALPIARELARRGHHVEIFLPADRSDPPEPATIDGVIVRSCRSPIVAMLEHALLGATITWQALRSRPDVVYAFKPIGYSGITLLVAWALRQVGRTKPILALDTDDWEGTGGWADRQPGSRLRSLLVDWHERWCLNHAEIVTVASRELERLARPTTTRLLYLPNAASATSPGWSIGDGEAFRRSIGARNVPIVLAYTRFLEFAPGRLVETFEKILRRVPAAQLVVAGKGLDGEEGVFRQMMAEHGLADRVNHLGWTSLDDLPNVFAAADVALYPLDNNLLNRAKCPMKLIDLVLAGVPVVSDRVGQASEYIVDGTTGYLVPSGDTSAMADRAIELLDDPVRRAQIGSAARQKLLSEWTWSNRAAVIDAAFRTAVQEHARQP